MNEKLRETIVEWRAREKFWTESAKSIPADSSRWSLAIARANCFGICAEELERTIGDAA